MYQSGLIIIFFTLFIYTVKKNKTTTIKTTTTSTTTTTTECTIKVPFLVHINCYSCRHCEEVTKYTDIIPCDYPNRCIKTYDENVSIKSTGSDNIKIPFENILQSDKKQQKKSRRTKKKRVSTLFEGASVILLLLATIFALIGHCNGDHKTLIACGLYILGGLSLGSGLVVFATVLSETFVEATSGKRSLAAAAVAVAASATNSGGSGSNTAAGQLATLPTFDYRYGWSFFAAVVAFVLAEIAALLSITAYLRRFPTVEDMVREMVPGAERKLREHQRLSSEYLVRHSGPLPTPGKYHHHHHHQHHYQHQYDPIPSAAVTVCTVNNRASKSDLHLSELEACDGGPLLSKTPPDVCTTGDSSKVDGLHIPGLIGEQELAPRLGQSLAGQTIPITIKNHTGGKFAYAATPGAYGPPNKFGTLPHHFGGGGNSSHQGFTPPSEATTSSHAHSHSHTRSMTLQHPRTTGKKSVTIGTFQTMDTAFPASGPSAATPSVSDVARRANAMHGYPGSAV